MRILYLGDTWVDGTCTHRRKALNRLGHDVLAINPADAYAAFSKIPLFSSINLRAVITPFLKLGTTANPAPRGRPYP